MPGLFAFEALFETALWTAEMDNFVLFLPEAIILAFRDRTTYNLA